MFKHVNMDKNDAAPKVKSINKEKFWAIAQIVLLGIICIFLIVGVSIVASIHYEPKMPEISFSIPPYKYAAKFPGPHKDQGSRNTCWAFALASYLEDSYRLNGIKKGFLKENEYVSFSVQSLAKLIVEECQKKENTKICDGYGQGPQSNTTEGGLPEWFYYLRNIHNHIYPESVCPYITKPGKDFECPGLEERMKNDSNPIRPKISRIHTAYSVEDMKALLREQSVGPVYFSWHPRNHIYIPCDTTKQNERNDQTVEYSKICELQKDSDSFVECPSYITKNKDTDKCFDWGAEPMNPEAEWYMAETFELFFGHIMQMVGYNDEWMTMKGLRQGEYGEGVGGGWRRGEKDIEPGREGAAYGRGAVGGDPERGVIILKNSWMRGSHSLNFFLGKHSTWDELTICPNVNNPMNWLSCTHLIFDDEKAPKTNAMQSSKNSNHLRTEVGQSILSPKQTGRRLRNIINHMANNLTQNLNGDEEKEMTPEEKSLAMCLDPKSSQDLIELTSQAHEFSCKDKQYGCDSDKYRYFFDSMKSDSNQMYYMRFVTILKEDNKTKGEFTLNWIPLQMISSVMEPIKEQRDKLKDDIDLCGYWAIPYSVIHRISRETEMPTASAFEIDWSDSSYECNSGSYPQYDYSLIKNSTHTQNQYPAWDGPLPYARRNNK
ncbi:putative papain family cysteine protease domain containing protein [Monocercomonoides exilis]|uniref:putative papain family cysteine protease domain containing protein n=1 Tax=Monocercomonoides exilis TaxID=2049356 RepID=UPI00355A58DD|nr:putative papain family cysteine protease domain containing protein [Monocercomonoides exilis]|eukprot:MONOS_2224.1-p1 / transcript=MONOS_2224.1 / gene=MONOS_2224 / organism=Monocercomonoides_exilis_PA203 / gene_product=papain family cysteine protease domain containing protein / transcript_product=papain family cysteine protease domain containing protein / location=Mono_scaffold00044:97690-99898(-) / protein_length=660 / sequence_SO=supercontig / SO=protein_coding / is_pseudo=false